MLLMDGLLSFPTVLLAITVVSFLGYGLPQVMIAIGVIYSPTFARIVRAETLVIKTEEYVEASRALGTRLPVIVFRHIVPNLLGKVIVQASVTFALAVVVEASLSFLGLGMQPPAASWGLMLKDARSFLSQAPWMAIYPGLALALTVLCFNVIGDTLSERLNPKVRYGTGGVLHPLQQPREVARLHLPARHDLLRRAAASGSRRAPRPWPGGWRGPGCRRSGAGACRARWPSAPPGARRSPAR